MKVIEIDGNNLVGPDMICTIANLLDLNVTIITALGGVRQQFHLKKLFFWEGEEQFAERAGRSILGYIVLSTTNIRREDGGEYRCAVNNTAGQQTEVNITVNVQGEQVHQHMYTVNLAEWHNDFAGIIHAGLIWVSQWCHW